MLTLVADDSRTTRLIIGKILRELGMGVIEAAHGVEALQQLEKNPGVELVLLDWNMPQMNGIDFLRRVRAEPAFKHVRILMVTSESQGAQVNQALEAGADEYLMKPFNKDLLLAKLNLMDVPVE